MKAENRIWQMAFLLLTAGILTGCGTAGKSPAASAGSETALPAYSTVFASDTEQRKETAVPKVPETDGEQPFDFLSDGSPTHKQLEAAAQEFVLWPSEEISVTMDSTGKLLHEEDVHVDRIRDVLTGETKYYAAYYKTYKKKAEWEYDVKMYSRMYDTAGTLVRDWAERQYESCVGDWVLSRKYIDFSSADGQEDTDGRLTNVKTGEETEDVASVDKISTSAAFVQKKSSEEAFTVDPAGTVVHDFSTVKDSIRDEYSFSVYQNYVIVERYVNPLYELLFYTPDGQLLGKIENVENSYVYDSGIVQPYVMCDNAIYDPSKGNGEDLPVLFQQGQTSYYDGELAICSESPDEDTAATYRLYDAKTGEALSEAYSSVAYQASVSGDAASSAFFVGTGENTLEKLDRTGQVVAAAEIENVGNVMICGNGIIANCNDYMDACLLNEQLQITVPVGTYTSIGPVYAYDASGDGYVADLWNGQYALDEEQIQQRSDLFTLDGTVLVKGASSIGAMQEGKLPVVRGFSMGLVDAEGNWLVKLAKDETMNAD